MYTTAGYEGIISDNSSKEFFVILQTFPCILIIFGATGDLTARKLMPALYHLKKEKVAGTISWFVI